MRRVSRKKASPFPKGGSTQLVHSVDRSMQNLNVERSWTGDDLLEQLHNRALGGQLRICSGICQINRQRASVASLGAGIRFVQGGEDTVVDEIDDERSWERKIYFLIFHEQVDCKNTFWPAISLERDTKKPSGHRLPTIRANQKRSLE